MRQCFIHVGTHKTATTSIQNFLSRHPQELERCGFLYPEEGRPTTDPAGHHNLAWELSGDRRYQPDYGDTKSLLHSITQTDRSIILSSEDFESSAYCIKQFNDFVASIKHIQFQVNLVVYFRNQIDYAESLYSTLVGLGFGRPFSAFCDEILETGAFQWREWVFPFRYDTFITHLKTVTGVEVVTRSYDTPTGRSPIFDFMSVVGLDAASLPWMHQMRDGLRPNLTKVVQQYLINRVGRPLTSTEVAAVKVFLRRAEGARPTMSVARQIDFAKTFDRCNRILCEQYGLPKFERMMQQELIAPSGLSLEEIFGCELLGILTD